ncbi:hypothetical protein BLNAU_1742 [Blattamonas nauphoetae]|uniref:Uncharacterized protein n=1 Tax=Blattamonas nauphoetae TaxID=2049346 RepID=A0ABQ9YHI5_9EUKA|nr:hypothetical protein BLNAU_1742 [Blattamonas nauphoetae]
MERRRFTIQVTFDACFSKHTGFLIPTIACSLLPTIACSLLPTIACSLLSTIACSLLPTIAYSLLSRYDMQSTSTSLPLQLLFNSDLSRLILFLRFDCVQRMKSTVLSLDLLPLNPTQLEKLVSRRCSVLT